MDDGMTSSNIFLRKLCYKNGEYAYITNSSIEFVQEIFPLDLFLLQNTFKLM